MMRVHSAFTLLELLIVMTLILVIATMAAPGLRRIQVRSELKSTAQNLQGELYATRLTAMKSGEAYLFRYQSQTGVYEILPKKVYDTLQPQSQPLVSQDIRTVGAPLTGTSRNQQQQEDSSVNTLPYRKNLPNRLTFGTIVKPNEPNRNSGEYLAPDSTRSVGASADSSLTSAPLLTDQNSSRPIWSEPIFFFPNGRISNGSLELLTVGSFRFRIKLTLRGLTGTARLGEVAILEDMTP